MKKKISYLFAALCLAASSQAMANTFALDANAIGGAYNKMQLEQI